MTTLIEFTDVAKTYGGQPIFTGFSCRLQRGEVIALLGPSGCGKTTLLNLAAGLAQPDSGSIRLHTDHIGYIFQEPRLIPWRTAGENIGLVLQTADKADVERIIGETLRKVGLQHAENRYPRQLSGGMKQRVSIARALALEPDMILMDEPFSALDLALKRELMDDMARLIGEREIGVMYVTHDPEEAARLADRVLIFSPPDRTFANEEIFPMPRLERTEAQIRQYKNKMMSIS
ncbi:ABC transporter ATP-binding protein [Paenibacillus macerans]|uniref:ABC transporter ATP-binding protein n=1 Tax=Paenibacillus macerans TaxID=44252 RepID=UPI00203B313E|nr:ABC transporter ATP-binding protein [Paenibacillus macerans]MCM3702044.1 ABC transporter ATP-binding protein [Paenibacillus macerans]